MKNKLRWVVVVLMAALLMVALSFAYGTLEPKKKETAQNSEAVSGEKKTMAPDFSLKDLKGNTVKLSDYKGKIVILNFWAVWCKYCKQEMPDLNELNKDFKKEDKVVLLAIDVQESADTVERYLKENKFDLNVLYDSEGSVAAQYGISGYPTTFVINTDGSVYTYVPGMTNKDTLLDIIKKMTE